MDLFEFWISYPAIVLNLGTLLALLLNVKVRAWWPWTVAVYGILAALVVCYTRIHVPFDFKLFWLCGKDIRAGIDYYAIDPRSGRQVVLNPPSALPLFVTFATFPLRKGARLWTLFNALAAFGLVPLANRVLKAESEIPSSRVSRATLLVLTAVVMLSQATGSTLALGQLSILTSVAILLALMAQERGRPTLAGLWLAVATVKIVTLIPFLLLFLGKRDRRTWLSFGVVTLGLCLATGRPSELPSRLRNNIRNIQVLASEGMVNDYSYAGPSHATIIAVDHALYRLGLRDRHLIQILQILAVVAMGIVVARIVFDPKSPRDGSCALVALYSMVFLYHRVYDGVILVLPLIYSARRIHQDSRPKKGPFVIIAACVLSVLFMHQKFLVLIEEISHRWGLWGGITRAIVLPGSLWFLLIAMTALAWEMRRSLETKKNEARVTNSPPGLPISSPSRRFPPERRQSARSQVGT